MRALRWWLSPRNPRTIYLLSGAIIATSFHLWTIATYLSPTRLMSVSFWMMAAGASLFGFALIHAQRGREMWRDAVKEAEEDQILQHCKVAIAESINDQLEHASCPKCGHMGQGRPVRVDNVTIH